MASTIFELTSISPRPGAAVQDIEAAERQLGVQLPDDYRAFLRESDGLEGFVGTNAYLVLWSTSEIGGLNRGYATAEFVPGLILIGTDGGGNGYGLLEGSYVQVPLVGMSVEATEPMSNTLVDLVRRLQRDVESVPAQALQTATQEIMEILARGDYEQLIARCASSKLSASDIRDVIREYGRNVIAPPDAVYDELDAVQVQGKPTWSVQVPLWTREEGRSDLTLELTITLRPEGPEVELDDLHVL